jgi:hypothetical protein
VQAAQATTATRHATPAWVGWILVLGAVLLVAWAWFIAGFLTEPSAVGRSRVVLVMAIGVGVVAAAAGLLSGFGVIAHRRWSWAAGMLASAVMILSVVGAITGVPALIGLWSSRKLS